MGVSWTEEQQKVIDTRNCNILVSAAAGSGKTAVLVERIIQRITDKNNPVDIDELLIVTFTRAAAGEMKERIRQAIEKKLEANPEDEHLQRQSTLVHHALITTIDSRLAELQKERQAQQEQPQAAPLEQAAEQPDPDSVFSKLPPEQQQEMTASVKAMLQTLIDADLKSTGEVSQGTKEAAQVQGFTIAGDGTLEQAKAPQEAAYRLESGDYLYIQTSETGYDYTLYGPDYKELDGGQLDNPGLSLVEAGKEILAIHERPAGTMEPLTGDGLDDFLEATEQANAIPQPQAWNGIDGLLNGKPFMPEASPADRAAALIELAEKNAPRLGSEERQLIVAYAEAVGDTDKVIGLINRLCEQGYELQKGQMDSFVKSEIGSEIAVANAQRQIAQNPAAEPVVTILWSESPHLKDGQQMPLHEAEAVFKELDSARRHEREQPGYTGHWYDKTKFRIDFTMQGQPVFSGKRIMCAAEYRCIHLVFPVRIKQIFQIFMKILSVEISPLNKIHQTRTRQRKNLCFLFVALHQHMKLFFMNCHRGCHHKDFGMFHAKCRRFQCRFNPDNRNIRIHLAQFPDSSTGGCIAGNHKTFCPLVKQLSCTSDRQFPYFFFFFCSVWRIFRIPEINKIFLRHNPDQFPQDTDSSHSGVKYRNWVFSL